MTLISPPAPQVGADAPFLLPYMTAQLRRQGWENRSEALAKGFIQVGWAMKCLQSNALESNYLNVLT
jgi:hypothetical protein